MGNGYTPISDIPKIRAELRAGFARGKLRSIEYRKSQLLALSYMLQDNQVRFQEALKQDLGRPPLESSVLDINGSIREAMLCYRRIDTWVKEERAPFDIKTFIVRPKLRKQAKGTVLIIGPFNFPLWCLFSPLAGAIAAGNAAVLKPSAQTPVTSSLVAELLNQYLDRDVYRVVLGTIPETTALLDLQWDHILFTGGGNGGKVVAAAAAKHLTPITLELGGKSPVIVDPTCDLSLTCRRILWGKTTNAGQICTGPDYVLIPRHFQDAFIQAMKAEYALFYPEGPRNSKSFSRIVGPSQFARVKALLDKTKGNIVIGGETDTSQKYVAPTIVRDVKPDDSLMSDELFAPILPIVPVANLDEAIEFINARDHPLALYLFSRDDKFKEKVMTNTLSGSVGINDVLLQVQAEGLPFGGVGPSGYGSHTGKFGFDVFTHIRPYIDSPWYLDWLATFRFPPYTAKKHEQANGAMLSALPSFVGNADTGDALITIVTFIFVMIFAFLGYSLCEGNMILVQSSGEILLSPSVNMFARGNMTPVLSSILGRDAGVDRISGL